MPARWQVTDSPDVRYRHWSDSRPMAFADPNWGRVLLAVGAKPLFAWHETGFGTLVACFRRGPLRIGVCGFPVAGPDWDRLSEKATREEASALCRAAGLDLIR